MSFNQRQPSEDGPAPQNLSTPIKLEPSDSLNKLTIADQDRYEPHPSDAMRPIKRVASDEDIRPSKIRPGSASTYSSSRPEQERPHMYSPPPDSSGFHSTHQTPEPPPRLHTLYSPSHQTTQQAAQFDADRKYVDPNPYSDYDADSGQDVPYEDTKMLLQPQTRPISQEQLVNEVKGIYAGLVMVEKKCVEICQQQAQTTNKLSNEQWQALIALHRTLLHEHHDFFLA